MVHSVQVSDWAAPTRAFGFYGIPLETATISCRPVPGVPHHKAVCYQCVLPGAQCRDAAKPPGSASELRFRRCATFTWHKLPSPEQVQQLQQVTRENTLTADDPFASLEGWHCKAEKVCNEAVRLGLASCDRPAERPKGSVPLSRSVASVSSLRPGESVLLRRWKRLHRAAVERQVSHHGSSPLSASQVRHWTVLVGHANLPANQAEAISVASAAVQTEAKRLQNESCKRWRRQFWTSSASAVKAGAKALKLCEPPDPNLNSATMTEEWENLWTKTHPAPQEAWDDVASAAGLDPAPSVSAFQPPSAEQLMQAIATCSGSAGFDGWSASELKGLMRACPCLADDLVRIFVSLLKAPRSEPVQKCRSRFFSFGVSWAFPRDVRLLLAQLPLLALSFGHGIGPCFVVFPRSRTGSSVVFRAVARLMLPRHGCRPLVCGGPSSTCVRPSTALTTALLACAGAAGAPEPVLEYFRHLVGPARLHGPRCASSQGCRSFLGPAGRGPLLPALPGLCPCSLDTAYGDAAIRLYG